MTITRADLATEIASGCDCSIAQAERILETILSSMSQSLSANQRVYVRGFGSFFARSRQARTVKNPWNGSEVVVSAKRTARFRASQSLLDSLNRSQAANLHSSVRDADKAESATA